MRGLPDACHSDALVRVADEAIQLFGIPYSTGRSLTSLDYQPSQALREYSS